MTARLLILISCFLGISYLSAQNQSNTFYEVGYGKSDITYLDDDLGLFGYGSYDHRIQEQSGYTSKLFCRVISVKHPNSGQSVFFLHADLGGIFEPLRLGLVAKIKKELDPNFDDACLMMTASHTHCAPSGLSHYALYMTPTPGYHPELVAYTVDSMFAAFKKAYEHTSLQSIDITEGTFHPDVPVAFNRAVKSHNQNKELNKKYKKTESHLCINRNMPVMGFTDKAGNARGMMNWFGVHPIEMLPDHNFINSASKGYAAEYAEEQMTGNDVAIFAQSGAGDVMTVDGHNPKSFNKRMHTILCDSSFNLSHSCIPHAIWNGQTQALKALEIRKSETILQVQGDIDYELIYVDLSNIVVDQQYADGFENARTSSPVLGAPFLSGEFTWRDINFRRFGLNFIGDLGYLTDRLHAPFYSAEKRAYKKHLYLSQSPKRLIANGDDKSFVGIQIKHTDKPGFRGFFLKFSEMQDPIVKEIMRQQRAGALEEHTLLPKILPLQIIKIGNIAIVGLPTEITTMAHNRLQKSINDILQKDGIQQVFISSYANEYAGYTTTPEEYIQQRYEGGHTLYGLHQLGAFQTLYANLAKQMMLPKEDRKLDRTTKAPVFSKEELDKRSHLKPIE